MAKPHFFYATGTSYFFDLFAQSLFEVPPFNIAVPGLNGLSAFWSGTIAADPFPTMLDPLKWSVTKVGYPAAVFPMLPSINTGVDKTVQGIKNLPAGTKFALGGQSQGAAVMSLVMKNHLQNSSSEIYNRRNDFIGAVMFGNPCRQTDKLWPAFTSVNGNTYAGGTFSGRFDVDNSTTGGHGPLPASYRMTNTPTTWFEFVGQRNAPLDPVTCCGDTTNGTNLQSLASDFINLTFELLVGLVFNSAKQTALAKLLSYPMDGHTGYPWYPPPGYPADGPTSYQIALDYLDTLGAQYMTAEPALPKSNANLATTVKISRTAGWSSRRRVPAA